MNDAKYYILLLILTLAMGFNTNLAAKAFQSGQFFVVGMNIAWDIYWILKMIELVFDK